LPDLLDVVLKRLFETLDIVGLFAQQLRALLLTAH
jgi:hypothetical protein